MKPNFSYSVAVKALTETCAHAIGSLPAVGILMLSQAVCFAQGTVTFGNNNSCRITNSLTGASVQQGQGIRAALYWSTSPSGQFVPVAGSTNVVVGMPVDGIFASGTVTNLLIQGGASAYFQVRAWGGGYATYDQAVQVQGTLTGKSAIVNVQTGNPFSDPPRWPQSLVSGGLTGFALSTNGVPDIINTNANRILLTVLSGGSLRFTYQGVGGVAYALDRTSSLSPPVSWMPQITNIAPGDGLLLITNPPVPATNNIYFWRIRSVP